MYVSFAFVTQTLDPLSTAGDSLWIQAPLPLEKLENARSFLILPANTCGHLICAQSVPPASDFDSKDSKREGNQLSQFAWDCSALKLKVLHPKTPLCPGQTGMIGHSSRNHTEKIIRTFRDTQATKSLREQSWEYTGPDQMVTAVGLGEGVQDGGWGRQLLLLGTRNQPI